MGGEGSERNDGGGEHGLKRRKKKRSSKRLFASSLDFECQTSPPACTPQNGRTVFFLCARLEHGVFTPQRERVGETRRCAWCRDAARKRTSERLLSLSLPGHRHLISVCEKKGPIPLSRAMSAASFSRFDQGGVSFPQRLAKAQSETRGREPRKSPGWDAGFDASILKKTLSLPSLSLNSP